MPETNSVAINNSSVVGSAINPVNYQGFRLSALYKINEDWNVLLTQSYQDMNSQGVFYEMPYSSEGTTFTATGKPIGSEPLPPLSVNLFNPSYDKDKFENTALTVNGKVGDLKLVYSGGYLVRNVDQVSDYTKLCARRVWFLFINAPALPARQRPRGNATRRARPGWKRRKTPTRRTNCG